MDSDVKKSGYILLSAGIFMIILAVIQVIFVFTANVDPVSLFSFKASDFAIDGAVLFPQLPSNLTKNMSVEIFPADLINKSLNLGANTILMSIIIFAGSKIASIGAQLLRPVNVKLKTNE